MTAALQPKTEAELAGMLADHQARRAPLRIVGGGTRVENDAAGVPLATTGLTGVVAYDPGEMTLIARAGTPLAEIEPLLAAAGQTLAFEPRMTKGATLGGMVAANASGPRRLMVGACRDALLGLRFVDGRGRLLKTGGRVMKNVTGLDLGKLLCGSNGTLAVLTEVAIKTLPLAPATATLVFEGTSAAEAVDIFTTALATPFEVSGAAWQDGTVWLRIEGLAPQVAYRQARLLALFAARHPHVLEQGQSRALWQGLRDLAHLPAAGPLWRILLRPTAAPVAVAALQGLGARVALDWGGGLIWASGPADAAALRAALPEGHATLIRRGGATGPAFPPQSGPLGALSARLRGMFDPGGILNPGLMER